jgi:hypothetical protein
LQGGHFGGLYCPCEKFFHALNSVAKTIKFTIAPGHKKVYQGWQLTGLKEVDKRVVRETWANVDALMAEQSHSEKGDTVVGISTRIIASDFETVIDMGQLASYFAKIKTLGYSPQF